MGTVDSKVEKRASRNDEPVFYTPPASLGEALARDVREAVHAWRGVKEAIARRCHVAPDTVYSWAERHNHVWTVEQIEAVTAETGGEHTPAWLLTLAGDAAPVRAAIGGDYGVLMALGKLGKKMAAITDKAAQDLAPDDDTPGDLDAGERRALAALAEELQAGLGLLRAVLG